MKHIICLSLPTGDKTLYSAAGICEFFSIAPPEFSRVEFDSFQKAEEFTWKKYGDNCQGFYIAETGI